MATTYKVMEVTDDHTYVVFTFDDGSGFGKMFQGLVCEDKQAFDQAMTSFLAGHVAEKAIETDRADKPKFDARTIIRAAQPVDEAVVAQALEDAQASVDTKLQVADEKRGL